MFFSSFFILFCWFQYEVYGASIAIYFDSIYICSSKSPPIIPYIRVYLNSTQIFNTTNTNESSDNPITLKNEHITINDYPATIVVDLYDYRSDFIRRSDELICSFNYSATISGESQQTCYSSLHLCTSYVNITTIISGVYTAEPTTFMTTGIESGSSSTTTSTTTTTTTLIPTSNDNNNSTTLISTINNNAIKENNVNNKNSNIRLIIIIVGCFVLLLIILLFMYGGYKYYKHKQENDDDKHSKTAAFIVENTNTNTNTNTDGERMNSTVATNQLIQDINNNNVIKSPRGSNKKLEIVITNVDQHDNGNEN